MGTIAKGEITLSPVNDAYTVLLTPSSCSISADFDGSNPALGNAKGTISVKRGTKSVPFKVDSTSTSSQDIQVNLTTQETNIVSFAIIKIPNTILEGHVKFHIITLDGFNYSTEVQFSFNIVRESTMLDWIQDWEGSKTKIGGTYIMTPKLFVGKKEAVLDTSGVEPTWKQGALTGVYIGPDLLASGEGSVGIYGYLKDKQIFHINADGGFIGGWVFNDAGLQSSNGIVNILSEGSIYAQNPDSENPYWGIYANGTASFANGNVKFFANGNAEFVGKITSVSGNIGGWMITKYQLLNGRILLDSNKGFIGIDASKIQKIDGSTSSYIFPETPDGGIKLWYSSSADFGLAGWTTGKKVFQLGSTNMIAGWNFNHQAIWTGSSVPSLTQGGYTSDPNALTIAPNGIRSSKWYVDANGTASFVGGSVKFNAENGEMFGWLMRSGRFSSKHTALISDESNSGVYISVVDISEVSGVSLRNTIHQNGGIYLYSDGVNSIMRAYDTAGNVGFSLRTTGYNTIASWAFDSNTIYIGSNKLSQDGFTLTEGSMALASSGIFGYKWKFLADGSGALAGGKINWDKNGNITVDAKISANNITTGTISTANIRNSNGTWYLNQDGSGSLAKNKIKWNSEGVLTVQNSQLTNVLINGAIKTPFRDGQYSLGIDGPISVSTPGLQNNNNVVIPGSDGGWNTVVTIPFTTDYNGFRAIIMNDDWGSDIAGGSWSVDAPDGKYFYEDGIPKKTLTLLPNTGVEMIGYGDEKTFKGWIILNRIEKSGNRGFPLHVCFYGIVNNGSLVKIKKYNDENITVSRLDTGIYRFTFGEAWSSADNYMVFLTGQAETAGRYASIYRKTNTYFDVYCGDDSSANDGNFQFMVINISPAYLIYNA